MGGGHGDPGAGTARRPMRHAVATALQGHRAGFVSRLVADAVDFGVVWAIGVSALLFAGVVRYLLVGPPFRLPVLPGWFLAAAGGVLTVGYLTCGWMWTGRTVGKQVAGLRVVDRSGRCLSMRRALPRAVLCVLFPAGLLWTLVSRRNASVQDVVVGSAVVYDWRYRPPEESPLAESPAEGEDRPPSGPDPAGR
jgi:uncharacterized RDD family membrane protein YckC